MRRLDRDGSPLLKQFDPNVFALVGVANSTYVEYGLLRSGFISALDAYVFDNPCIVLE